MLSLHWSQASGYHLGIRQMALDELVEYRGDRKLEDFPLEKGGFCIQSKRVEGAFGGFWGLKLLRV